MDAHRNADYKLPKWVKFIMMSLVFIIFLLVCLLYGGNSPDIQEHSSNEVQHPTLKINPPVVDTNDPYTTSKATHKSTHKQYSDWINQLDPRRIIMEHKMRMAKLKHNHDITTTEDTNDYTVDYETADNENNYSGMDEIFFSNNLTDPDAE